MKPKSEKVSLDPEPKNLCFRYLRTPPTLKTKLIQYWETLRYSDHDDWWTNLTSYLSLPL